MQARARFSAILPIEFLEAMEDRMGSWEPSKGPRVDISKGKLDLNANTESAIRSLVWFKKNITKGLLEHVSTHDINKAIGNFQLIKDLPKDIQKLLPEEFQNIRNWTAKQGWEVTLAISQLSWESVVDTKLLGTFISRLFINSFDTSKVKQNFTLLYAPDSITDRIKKTLGSKQVEELLGVPLNAFNSSSISVAYALKMLDLWDRTSKKGGRRDITKY